MKNKKQHRGGRKPKKDPSIFGYSVSLKTMSQTQRCVKREVAIDLNIILGTVEIETGINSVFLKLINELFSMFINTSKYTSQNITYFIGQSKPLRISIPSKHTK